MKSWETRLSVNDVTSFMVLRVFTDHQGCLKSIKPVSGVNMFVLAITSLGAKRTRLGHQACIPSAWENHMWSVTALPFRLALSGIRRTRSYEDGPRTRAQGFHLILSSGTILHSFWLLLPIPMAYSGQWEQRGCHMNNSPGIILDNRF